MAAIVKEYTLRKEDGYSEERTFDIKKDGSIRFELTYKTRLIPFAMDENKEDFIVFMIEREEELNIFVWVELRDRDRDKVVRLTAVNDLMIFSKFTDEPMDISGAYPDEAVHRALRILGDQPMEELFRAYKEMQEKINDIGGYDRWKETERALLHDVKRTRQEGTNAFYMY